MDIASKVAAVLFGLFILWGLIKFVRSNPESLSWESLNKSFGAMGILAIILIAFIAVVVMLLRRT